MKKHHSLYIYLRSTKERIPCTEEEFHNYYRDIDSFRKKQQRHKLCACPTAKQLECDMDCANCPFRRFDENISLDYTHTDDDGNESSWGDTIADPDSEEPSFYEDPELIGALRDIVSRLSEEERNICAAIMRDESERSAAASMGLSRNTYVYRRNRLLEYLKKSLKNFM